MPTSYCCIGCIGVHLLGVRRTLFIIYLLFSASNTIRGMTLADNAPASRWSDTQELPRSKCDCGSSISCVCGFPVQACGVHNSLAICLNIKVNNSTISFYLPSRLQWQTSLSCFLPLFLQAISLTTPTFSTRSATSASEIPITTPPFSTRELLLLLSNHPQPT
jgi:hypothetical protein